MTRNSIISTSTTKSVTGRILDSKTFSTLTSEASVYKSKVWKHICPCDELKNQDSITISTQCLCEEIDLEKELTLFFYNVITTSKKIGEYCFEPSTPDSKKNSVSVRYSHSKQRSLEKKDLRRLSQDDKRHSLIGTKGSEVMIKKIKKKTAKNILKDHSTQSPKDRKAGSPILHPITEDNTSEYVVTEKLISTTNFELDWLVKRDEKYAKISFNNGNIYEGDVLDKLPNGIGTFNWADGTVYEGEFQDGSPSGKGRMQLPDLTEYIGIFYKGYFHEKGVYNIRNTNIVYSGNWKYGKKHGYGWLLYEPGSWYEGEFKEDLRHGNGFFQFGNKSCYQGEYSKNKREGRGAMRWSNNDIYIGQWSEGKMGGFGEYTWRTDFENCLLFRVQHHYQGSWVEGKRTGTGVMYFGNENGAKMAGIFQDNYKHGAAVVMCGNGKSIERKPLFLNDKPVHNSAHSNENIEKASSSFTFKEQVFERSVGKILKQNISKIADLDNANHGALCYPIEIQINAPPDDIELNFYIEKALNMYLYAFDTIQFDLESMDSCCSTNTNTSKLQLSKLNLMINSPDYSKLRPEYQARHSLNHNPSNYNKSERRIQSTVRIEEKYLRNIITRYLPKLMEIYYHYATLTSPTKVYFKHYMIRLFLWQLYLDLEITTLGISLVETDKFLDENPASFVESCHHPFEHIYFFQFIQSLMGAALLVHYKSKEELLPSEGLMPHIFQKFLLERVFILAGKHKGRCLFEYKDILPMKNVYALYLKLGEPHTARTFLNATCTKKGEDPPCYKSWPENKCCSVSYSLGHNVNLAGHNLFYPTDKIDVGEPPSKSFEITDDTDPFFQDLMSFRVLGPKLVVQCLSSVCPPILKNGSLCNMDYPMTFLEFYEVLLCCSLLMVARSKKKKELIDKITSIKTDKEEEDLSAEHSPKLIEKSKKRK